MKKLETLFAATAALALAVIPAAAQSRPLGDSKFIASIPSPGFPEGIATRGNKLFASGPAAPGITTPAMVWQYDIKSGHLDAQFPVTISNPFLPFHALSCIAFGPDGLYAIEPYVGIIRMHLDPHNTQEVYSLFPPPPPATGSLLNDLTFDGDGNLYVTDSFQGAIFKIAAGGGAPVVWFQDPRLLGNPAFPFGVNGIRIDKNSKNVYMTVTFRAGDFSGAVYRLPLVASPAASDLHEFHVYPATTGLPGPDGIAFGKSGNLYVALNAASMISVLRPDGTEAAIYAGPAQIPGAFSLLPWANPSNITFNNQQGTLLVTNHAIFVPYDPSLFAIFDVFVNDKAEPLR